MKVPDGDDWAWGERLIKRGLVASPGSMFGPEGKGYIRWALVPTLEKCREALTRLDSSPDGTSA